MPKNMTPEMLRARAHIATSRRSGNAAEEDAWRRRYAVERVLADISEAREALIEVISEDPALDFHAGPTDSSAYDLLKLQVETLVDLVLYVDGRRHGFDGFEEIPSLNDWIIDGLAQRWNASKTES